MQMNNHNIILIFNHSDLYKPLHGFVYYVRIRLW